jgi:hypothetical protein
MDMTRFGMKPSNTPDIFIIVGFDADLILQMNSCSYDMSFLTKLIVDINGSIQYVILGTLQHVYRPDRGIIIHCTNK